MQTHTETSVGLHPLRSKWVHWQIEIRGVEKGGRVGGGGSKDETSAKSFRHRKSRK